MKRITLIVILLASVQFCASAQNWQTVGAKKFNAEVDQLFADTATGELFCTGMFWYNDTVAAYGLAKWNGTEWDSVFTNPGNNAQKRLAKFHGSYYLTKSPYVFRWNGNAWDTVGHVMGAPYGMFNDGDSVLYVFGAFNGIDNVNACGIIRYDGSSWSAIDGTVWSTNGISTAYRYQGDLYIGGVFYSTTLGIDRIARWDGVSWHAVGQGVTGSFGAVFCFEEYAGQLYAGGYMESSAGNPGDFVARWDGTNWTQAGGGVNYQVLYLKSFGGYLWALGQFNQAGGIPATCVARYDGTDWCSVGVFDNAMDAAEVYNGELYIAGGVWTIDGDSVNKVVKWIGGNNSDSCGHLNTGVEEGALSQNVSVYPNPATTTATFSVHDATQMFELIMYDNLGREVWRGKSERESLELSTEGFEPGMYLYRIIENGKPTAAGKLIIE